MAVIEVNNLVKVYKRKAGRSADSEVDPDMSEKQMPSKDRQKTKPRVRAPRKVFLRAVDDISFSIDEGEMIGYIGANGAGKSTTIKMLTGILTPDSGVISVNGMTPYKQRKKNAKNIGVVFGQRTQLWWDLPVIDSFRLLRHIYDIPKNEYQRNIETFQDVLEIGSFINVPVRQLSLGQRMRADIAASLLHNPSLLYLDEPTIGLDPYAKEKMRDFIRLQNHEKNITVILTTHDMSDIEDLCKRVMIIEKGKLVYDDSIEMMKGFFGNNKILKVEFCNRDIYIPEELTIIKEQGNIKWFKLSKENKQASQIIAAVFLRNEISDLSITDESIESIVKKIYEKGLTMNK